MRPKGLLLRCASQIASVACKALCRSGGRSVGSFYMLLISFRRVPARFLFRWALALLLVVGGLDNTSPLFAANPLVAPAATVPPKEDLFTLESVTARRTALQIETTRARSDLKQLPETTADETALALTQEIGLLARLDRVHGDQLRTLQHAADLAQESLAITARTQDPSPPDARLPAPHGLTLLDKLYTERDYLVRAEALLKTDLENASTALADARDDLADKDRLRRSAKEAGPGTADRRLASRRLAELESRLAGETVLLAEGALKTLRLQQSLLAPKLALLLPDLSWLHANLVLSADDLAAQELEQKKRLSELDATIEATATEAERVERLVLLAERRMAANTDPAKTASDGLESRRADRQTVNLTLSAYTALRARQAVFTEVEQLRRRVLANQGQPAEYKTWATANRDALERLPKDRRTRLRELRQSRHELQELRTRLASPMPGTTEGAPAASWTLDRVKHLEAWIACGELDLADLTDLATARSRLREELASRVFDFSIPDTLGAAWRHIVTAWDYEVFSVTDRPVRVRTIFFLLALVIVGHWVARRASELVGRTVFRRLGMNTGHRAAWQTLSFYGLFLLVLLIATNLLHLSLTQFSVVSGALAVGIGFGSQTLISNFISGIILLLERPVNQGDVIEIDGQQMTVERLGPRSTLVRSFDNAQIIVPNSRLLEENVINWTLSDDVVRTRIIVGVAYGSPTREVARLLEAVLVGMEEVKREPAPLVVLTAFGESSLNFEASFWSKFQGRKELDSELRHRITESFADAGIVMAFPQRDVHLVTTKPLRVEMIPAAPPVA